MLCTARKMTVSVWSFLVRIVPHSENTHQKFSEYGRFPRSDGFL